MVQIGADAKRHAKVALTERLVDTEIANNLPLLLGMIL
jgi:hypothetical protein